MIIKISSFEEYSQLKSIQKQIEESVKPQSKLYNDFQNRLGVLKDLGYIGDDGVLTEKGRAASAVTLILIE